MKSITQIFDKQDKSPKTPEQFGQALLAEVSTEKGSTAKALALIEAGATLEEKDVALNTPLMWAIFFLHTEVALTLIQKGAATDIENFTHHTPLMFASFTDQIVIMEALLAKNVSLDKKNHHGETALILATHQNRPKAVKVLTKAGAELNERDMFGKNVFDYAKQYAATEILHTVNAVLKRQTTDFQTGTNTAIQTSSQRLVLRKPAPSI